MSRRPLKSRRKTGGQPLTFRVWYRHSNMWRGWKWLMTLAGHTAEQAVEAAKNGLFYYEGTTAWKVTRRGFRRAGKARR